MSCWLLVPPLPEAPQLSRWLGRGLGCRLPCWEPSWEPLGAHPDVPPPALLGCYPGSTSPGRPGRGGNVCPVTGLSHRLPAGGPGPAGPAAWCGGLWEVLPYGVALMWPSWPHGFCVQRQTACFLSGQVEGEATSWPRAGVAAEGAAGSPGPSPAPMASPPPGAWVGWWLPRQACAGS